MPYSIVLVDDHDLIREGLKPLIEADPAFRVTAQFGNGRELLDALPGLAPPPDVVILDLDMPVLNGRDTLLHLQALPEAPPALVLTISGDDATVLDMVRMGARGFLPKYCTRQELTRALHDMVQTGYYHSELEVAALHQSARAGTRAAPPVHLTAREREFVRLVCDKRELPYKLIADEMGVSFRTVDGYRQAIFLKLDVKTKTGLVFYALRTGIVTLQELLA